MLTHNYRTSFKRGRRKKQKQRRPNYEKGKKIVARENNEGASDDIGYSSDCGGFMFFSNLDMVAEAK